MENLLELSSDTTKYVVIEERLMEAHRNKWEHVQITKLKYYIANIDTKCLFQYKAKRAYWSHSSVSYYLHGYKIW